MKQKYRIPDSWKVVSMACCLLMAFTTCDTIDELNTNILDSKEITVKAFGPNPALRGQKLSIAGTHLDRITGVILPNNVEVSDIEVVSDKLIKIVVPRATVGGVVRLVGANGFEFSFESPLSISEPISISSMSPQPVKAGQLLTLEGDYFNLIDKVILADKVEISSDDFVTYERTKIELIVPAEAQTGAVTLADNAEMPLEYESPEVLQIVLPSVSEVSDLSGNKPGNLISLPVNDLDLMVKVEMPDRAEVAFEVEGNQLIFTLPENIGDGAITVYPASGVAVVIAQVGVPIPEDLTVTPNEELRGGDEITVTGVNLELVTNVGFAGVDNAVDPISKSATELKVLFPEMAQSGDMILNMANGKQVTVPVLTQKPRVTSFNPSPVSAGTDATLIGENLDLVSSVTFAEELLVEVMPGQADELNVNVPLNAVPGPLLLTMANGETVETEPLEVQAPLFCYIPNPPGPKAEIHAGGVLTVQVENGTNLTGVTINDAPVNFILDAPNLYIVIPGNAKGETGLKLISSNGEAHYTIPVIGAGIVETVIYEGDLFELNWSNPLRLDKELFESVPAGSKLKIYMAESIAGASIAYNDANWTKIIIEDPNFDPQWGTLSVPEGTTSYEIELTSDILHTILTVSDGWSQTGIMLNGNDVMVSKVSIIVGTEPEEVPVLEGTHDLRWDNPIRIYKEDLEGVRAGTVMKLYFTPGGSPSFAVQDANWGKVEFPDDPNYDSQWGSITIPEGEESYELVLTQAVLDVVMSVDDGWSTTAIIFGGQDMTVTKITLIGN